MGTNTKICIWMVIWFFISMICVKSLETSSSEIIAYDCSNHNPNFTIVNLNNVGTCDHVTTDVVSVSKEIQLIEVVDDLKTTVSHCQIILHRIIVNCGMHSHSSIVKNALISYPMPISEQKCRDVIRHGEFCLYCGTPMQRLIRDLRVGTSKRVPLTLAGRVDDTGSCKGGNYADAFGAWSNVVVEGFIQITTSQIEASVNLNDNIIHLPNHLQCQYKNKACHDDITGSYFWEMISEDACKTNKHKVLYEGPANFTYERSAGNTKNEDLASGIVTVTSDSILFSLQLLGKHSICNLRAYNTEHPKLILVEKVGAYFHFTPNNKHTDDMDLFTYFNSKFVYIERNIKSNMETLYRSIHLQKCELEMLTLKLNLALASYDPVEFGYIFGGGPGYVGTKVGEVIYVSKCQPVYVALQKLPKCYHELPVLYQNVTYYRTPKTHLLQKYGSEVTCSNIFPSMHQLLGTWYKVHHGYTETITPQLLKPANTLLWKYKDVTNLAKAGIYTQEDLNSLRSHIMYGNERTAVETVLARSTQGFSPNLQGLDMSNLLDETSVEKIGQKFGEKLWSYFSVFGNISSGLIGLFFVLKTIKWFANLVISGALLYEIYGISYKLFGCCFESLTSWLIHNGKNVPNKSQKENIDKSDGGDIEEVIALNPSCPKRELPISSYDPLCKVYPSLNPGH